MSKASLCRGLLAFALLLGGGTTQAEVTLGALFPLSGPLAVLGQESFRGVELAAEARNAQGGINGEPIELIKGDAVDNNQAVGEARRLISVAGVEAILGTYSSSRSFAASQAAELSGVPYFELGAISDPITERGFQYLFRLNPTAQDFAETIVDAVPDALAPALGLDPETLKVAIIHEDSLYGQTVAGFQKERAAERGLNVVEVLPYSAKAVDLSSVILRLKGAEVDAVLQTSYQNDTVLFLQQSQDFDFSPAMVIGTGGGYSLKDSYEAVGATGMEGKFNVDFPQYRLNPEATPGIDDFIQRYQDKYGHFPRSGHSLANFFGANAVFDILAAAESLEADAVRAAAMAMDQPINQSVTGWGVKFDEKGQNQRGRAYMMQWQDGELVTVHPPEVAVAEILPDGRHR